MMLAMPIMGHGVMPFFGTFLTGISGTAFCLALAALWGCARGFCINWMRGAGG